MGGPVWQPVQMGFIEARLPRYRDRINGHEYFPGENEFEIPDLRPETFVPEALARWHDKAAYPGAAVHFFLDDYRFEAAWNDPPGTIARLAHADAVLTPDFSLWREMPFAVRIWQTYRRHWMGAYWQSRGLRVIPTVEWTHPVDDWMFDGLPRDSVLAVQAFATLARDDLAMATFVEGWERIEALSPRCVLVYGQLPFEARVPIREYSVFTAQNRRRLDRWAVEEDRVVEQEGDRAEAVVAP